MTNNKKPIELVSWDTSFMSNMCLTLFNLINETRSCSEEEMFAELEFHGIHKDNIDAMRYGYFNTNNNGGNYNEK